MIKNFIYLDEYKMYSLSSQIFEGITESLITTKNEVKEESEEQKGKVGSGRILADILKAESAITEQKYLHDYAYTLFEKELIKKEKVLDINSVSKEKIQELIPQHSFVKISGKAIFNDIEAFNSTIENFNEIGEAITYLTHHEEIKNNKDILKEQKQSTKDRNLQNKLTKDGKNLNAKISELAKKTGLYQDPKLLEKIAFLLKYGFQDQFEIQIPLFDYLFSSNLKRDSLREKEDLLVRKYSRKTEKNFVIFGVVTQLTGDINLDLDNANNNENLKEALMNMVSHFTNMENTFTGKLSNEIVIDPIAIYTEL